MPYYPSPSTGSSVVHTRAVTDLEVVSSTTETTVFTATIAGSTLSTNKMLRFAMVGSFLQNSGVSSTFRIRIKLGSTTLYDATSVTFSDLSTDRPLSVLFWMANQNATNDQVGGGVLKCNSSGAATTGLGVLTASNNSYGGEFVTADGAVDTTAAQDFVVTVENSRNHASVSFKRRMAVLEII